MKWIDFNDRMLRLGLPAFSLREGLRLTGLDYAAGKTQFGRWASAGRLIRLKNGLYLLKSPYERGEIPEYYVAGRLYYPSYVSLESALSFYNLIPETAFQVTSVATKPTRRFEVESTFYTYRTVRPRYFTGYVVERHRGFSVRIAEREKAVVDYLYFSIRDRTEPLERLSLKGLNPRKMLAYARLNGSKKLLQLVEGLC